jgi:hypothetical protein
MILGARVFSFLILIAVVFGPGLTAGAAQGAEPASSLSRGEAITTAQKQAALPVASLVAASKTTSESKEVVLKGRIDKVCQSKGCWFTIRDAKEPEGKKDGWSVRVTSKGYLFFVPKDLAGRTAFVRGVLTRKKLSADEAQHFIDDEARATAAKASAGAPAGVSEKAASKTKAKETDEWQLEAMGVAWEG